MDRELRDMPRRVQSESGHMVPVFGIPPAKPGLYLAFFHGRREPNERMKDWGFDGPLIGPLEWFHTVYAATLRIQFLALEDEQEYFAKPCFPEAQDMDIHDDLAVYAGAFYSDWTVFVVPPGETEKPSDSFRSSKRRNYAVAQKNKIKSHKD